MTKRASLVGYAILAFGLVGGVQLGRAAEVRGNPETSRVEVGERMYREGLLPSGAPMVAKVQGDVELPGTLATCISCHQRSGLGSTEGAALALAVTGGELYKPRVRSHEGHFGERLEGPGTRPAYTDETLARAIREGLDPAGRVLDPQMPRYDLGDQDLAQLIAYLKILSSEPPPGVTETDIHFATIVAGDVAPDARKALADVLQAFFAAKNAGSRHEQRRAERPPWFKEWKYAA